MIYSKDEWAKMKWNLDALNASDSVLEKYPDLASIFEPLTEKLSVLPISADMAVKFIILSYHRKSPFVINLADTIQRKTEVLSYLGLKRDKNNRYGTGIEEMIFVQNENLAYATIHFLKYENDRLWAKYCVNSELYWRAMFYTMKEGETVGSKGADEILKIQLENKKKLGEIEREMEIQETTLFADDKELVNFFASYMEESKKVKVFPEDFVMNEK